MLLILYPSSSNRKREEAHLLPIEDYIKKRRETITPYARGTEIYKECIEKSKYIKFNNALNWWPNNENDNENDSKQNNEQQVTEYDTYDRNEIELEWETESDSDYIINETGITQ